MIIFFTSTRNQLTFLPPFSFLKLTSKSPKQLLFFFTPMDFRFRAIDNKPPAAASSSKSPSDQPPQDDSTNAELVNQRIKEEMMIREIVNRRMLEAEIRRELILERELAMLRAGLAFHEPSAVRLSDQRLNHVVDQSSSRGLLSLPAISGSRSLLNSLPVRPVLELQKEELKALDDEKKKCFILTKPDPEIFEAKKRKVEGPPEVAEGHDDHTEPVQPSSSRNSANDKFICKICNITTTSEITFKTHLEGKKHKTKEGRTLQTRDHVPNQLPAPTNGGKSTPQQPALQSKGGFKFWCQMCEQGSNSMVVMNTHYTGRKHMTRLLKFGESNLDQQGNDEPTSLNA